MKNLILDCSCGMSVYVVCDDKVFSRIDRTQNKHTDEILNVVDELLSQAKIKIKDIDNICVCVGPGSFTGVRVAISIAKGLVLGTNAKVFTLSNFDIFKQNFSENYYLVLDGFSDFVYVRKFENGKIEDDCDDVEKFAESQKQNNFKVYVTTEKTQNMLKKYEIQSKFTENDIIIAFNEKILKNDFTQLNRIYPVYLRASQAEIERAKKL